MGRQKRLAYIDNIRWMTILLLIPFHAGMAFNSWEGNYVLFDSDRLICSFVQIIWPWLMPILFVVAGISTRLSILKRGYKKYIVERIKKLLLPLIIGTICVVPIMTYFANMGNSGFDGDFNDHLYYFFTTMTDGTGYDGAFTIGHLWFLAYLFVISLIGLFVILLSKEISKKMQKQDIYDSAISDLNRKQQESLRKPYQYFLLVFFFVIPGLFSGILTIGGKGLISYLSYYLIGYYVFYDGETVKKISAYRHIFMILYFIFAALNVYMFLYMENANGFLNKLAMYAAGWFGCLFIIGVTSTRLNKSNKVMKWLSKNSFLFYILHFPVLISVQYYIGMKYESIMHRFLFAIIISYIITFLLTSFFSLFDNVACKVTAVRVVCSLYMVLIVPFTGLFWILYFAAGISDAVDGVLARKLKICGKKGAILDSVSDLIFAGAIIYTLVTNVVIPSYVWKMCIAVILIKTFTCIEGLVFHKKIIFLHTILNKVTGVMLFMFFVVFQLFKIKLLTMVIGTVAILAALEECLIVGRQNKIDPDEKGYITRTNFYYNVISGEKKTKRF